MWSLNFFFSCPNPSSRTMALESRNEYREYSWNVLGGKERQARTADNLTTIYEPIV
jgi:hypothetical protein